MKVAHLTTVDLSLRYLVFPQLAATRDLGIDTIGVSAPGPWVPGLEEDGIRHIPLPASTRGMNVLADLRAAGQLWRVVRRERPDILHTHNPKPGLYGRVLGRLAGVPIVVNTVHGLYATPEDRFLKRLVVYALEAVASRFSHAELVQSAEDVATIERLHLAPAGRVHHLGNGVDLARFDPDRFSNEERTRARKEIGAGPDEVVVGMVGRLVAEKGYPEFLEAVGRLDDRYVAVCIGPDDEDKSDALPRDLVAKAEEQGVRFLGMRTDVDRLYAAMDVFVLPSHREGFPRSAMEAAAMGLPVIATDIRGCRDVVAPDENGILVGVGAATELVAAIERLGNDGELRRRMGEAGRRRALTHFDESSVVGRVLATYRRLAQQKGVSMPGAAGGDVAVRTAVAADAPTLARLHSEGISTGFLPSLGPRFMTRLYRALIDFSDGLVLVLDDGSGPVGFVAGVLDTGAFYKHFLRHHGIAAGMAALPRAVRPSVSKRAWESLRYEGADDAAAELLATALEPEMRGRGLGTELGARFLTQLGERGAEAVRVVVGSSNGQAIAAYRKMGFATAGTIEVHAGEESTVMLWPA
ncbi:MAG: GNAT family N-acetyltransferase [Acidimicrobiia bacterium]|nr:GNAT family N-acetyltransferase [Acidimicrobiia bacterium]